jgi:hypothetical protein
MQGHAGGKRQKEEIDGRRENVARQSSEGRETGWSVPLENIVSWRAAGE